MESTQPPISLLKASALACMVAAIALVLFILPAEYNIDATGLGEKMGLTVFNQAAPSPAIKAQTGSTQQSVIVTVPAGKGVEYKLAMTQYQKVTYQWSTSHGDVYVDLHGEPKGDTTGYFESYTIATVGSMKGSFTAPFEGSHGWYWKNKTTKDIQIQLIFSGEFVIEGLK
jgi:hypothetical protein